MSSDEKVKKNPSRSRPIKRRRKTDEEIVRAVVDKVVLKERKAMREKKRSSVSGDENSNKVPLWDNEGVRKRQIEETLTFTYRGEAFDEGTMSLDNFGRALIGYNAMVTQVVREIAPDVEQAQVNFKHTEQGSFIAVVSLVADETLWEAVKRFFTSDDVEKVVTIAGGIGAGVVTVGGVLAKAVSLVKNRRGRKIEHVETQGDDTTVTYGDGETVNVPTQIYNITTNNIFLNGAKQVLEPLMEQGVDSVDFSSGEASALVETKDRVFFAPLEDERDSVDVEEATLRLRSISFDQGAVWKFTRVYPPYENRIEENLSARIEDKDFLARVDSGYHRFAKGDGLLARLSIERPSEKSGRRPRFTIVEVIKVYCNEPLFE